MPCAHVYLAPGFEEVEFVMIVDILRRAGIQTTTLSLDETLHIAGAHGIIIQADQPFSAAIASPDMVILPGGGPGTQALLAAQDLHNRLRSQIEEGKRVAAVCAAPTVLAYAGILKDKKATCYPGCEAALHNGGAHVEAYNVITDGLVTTSRGAGTTADFALELVRLLLDADKARTVSQAMLFH